MLERECVPGQRKTISSGTQAQTFCTLAEPITPKGGAAEQLARANLAGYLQSHYALPIESPYNEEALPAPAERLSSRPLGNLLQSS